MVTIGSARIDERGKAYGGKAGDQTAKEVGTQAWYKHSKGWRVFRAKDLAKRLLIAEAMQAACKNNNIGYDQWERLSLYNAVKDYGFDPAKAVKAVETDCSALVRVCCAYAGIMLPNFTTDAQPNAMLKSGEFEEMKGSKYTDADGYLAVGDVLVTKTKGHTVVVLTNGDKAEGPANPTPVGDLIVADGQWNVRTGPATNWPSVCIVKGGERLQSVDAGGWIPVLTDNQVRWISPKAVGNAGSPTVAPGTWNVRSGPGTGYPIVKTLTGGTKLQTVDAGGWIPVLIDGQVRWISPKGVK